MVIGNLGLLVTGKCGQTISIAVPVDYHECIFSRSQKILTCYRLSNFTYLVGRHDMVMVLKNLDLTQG